MGRKRKKANKPSNSVNLSDWLNTPPSITDQSTNTRWQSAFKTAWSEASKKPAAYKLQLSSPAKKFTDYLQIYNKMINKLCTQNDLTALKELVITSELVIDTYLFIAAAHKKMAFEPDIEYKADDSTQELRDIIREMNSYEIAKPGKRKKEFKLEHMIQITRGIVTINKNVFSIKLHHKFTALAIAHTCFEESDDLVKALANFEKLYETVNYFSAHDEKHQPAIIQFTELVFSSAQIYQGPCSDIIARHMRNIIINMWGNNITNNTVVSAMAIYFAHADRVISITNFLNFILDPADQFIISKAKYDQAEVTLLKNIIILCAEFVTVLKEQQQAEDISNIIFAKIIPFLSKVLTYHEGYYHEAPPARENISYFLEQLLTDLETLSALLTSMTNNHKLEALANLCVELSNAQTKKLIRAEQINEIRRELEIEDKAQNEQWQKDQIAAQERRQRIKSIANRSSAAIDKTEQKQYEPSEIALSDQIENDNHILKDIFDTVDAPLLDYPGLLKQIRFGCHLLNKLKKEFESSNSNLNQGSKTARLLRISRENVIIYHVNLIKESMEKQQISHESLLKDFEEIFITVSEFQHETVTAFAASELSADLYTGSLIPYLNLNQALINSHSFFADWLQLWQNNAWVALWTTILSARCAQLNCDNRFAEFFTDAVKNLISLYSELIALKPSYLEFHQAKMDRIDYYKATKTGNNFTIITDEQEEAHKQTTRSKEQENITWANKNRQISQNTIDTVFINRQAECTTLTQIYERPQAKHQEFSQQVIVFHPTFIIYPHPQTFFISPPQYSDDTLYKLVEAAIDKIGSNHVFHTGADYDQVERKLKNASYISRQLLPNTEISIFCSQAAKYFAERKLQDCKQACENVLKALQPIRYAENPESQETVAILTA